MTITGPERPLRVYLILGVGLISISVSAILIRYAGDAPALAVAAWRTLFAALILAPFVIRRAGKEIRELSGREIGIILASGVFLGLHFITWISSVYHTSVASASVLVSMSPIFIGIIGFLVLKERLRRIEASAIVVAMGGTVLIGLSSSGTIDVPSPDPLFGNSLALSAAFFVSVYFLIGQVVRRERSWLAYVGPVYGTAAVTTWLAALVLGIPLFGYSMEIYLLCLGMAIFPQILGHGSFNYAIKWFPASTLGIASLAEPVGASILAYFLFSEVPTIMAIAGMICVLIAVVAALYPVAAVDP